MIHIREYEHSDLHEVLELMEDLGYPSTYEQLHRRMDHITSFPHYRTFIAELDGHVAGMIGLRELHSYEFDNLVIQISLLVTKHELQGRGVGKTLIRYAEQWAADRGSSMLVLTSGNKPERAAAHKFYMKLGFETTGYRFVKKVGSNN